MRIFQKILFASTVFFIAAFMTPTTVNADILSGLLEKCVYGAGCDWGLHCPGTQLFGQDLEVKQVCFPEADTKKCGVYGDCSQRPDDRKSCVGLYSPILKSSAVTCLANKDFAQKDKGPETDDYCVTTANCGAGKQCVRTMVWDSEFFGISEFAQSKRCVDIKNLPANFVEADTTGSCGQNQVCTDNQSCVENTYVDATLQSAGINLPGALSVKKFVCYDKTKVSSACSPVASTRVVGDKTEYCMNVYDQGQLKPYWINADSMPNGPNSPSEIICNEDKDCKKLGADRYCLVNPVNKKKQCFAQNLIYTNMALPDVGLCTDLSVCDCTKTNAPNTCKFPGAEPSLCTSYADKPSVLVCIKNDDNGAALGSGAGTATATTPPALKPDVAKQTYEMYAPKLQVDVPGLTFDGNITAEDGDNGIKSYSVPYLATYINAVYKYSLGLGVLIAIIIIMYSGMRWMTAFGNAKAVSEARSMIGNAVSGLALLFGVYSILYVLNPNLSNLNSIQILAPKQEVFETSSLVGEIVESAGESAGNPNTDQGTATVVDSPGSHKSSVGPNRKLTDADIRSAAKTSGIDECFLWAFAKKESGGNLHAIGDDENYPNNNKPVNARRDFLMSGKKYNGESFTPPTTGTYDHKTMNSYKAYNNDKFQPENPPSYGIDWRFSHGIGYLQLTIFPTKNNSMGKLIQGPNGPEWARSIRGKWYTVSDLLNPDSALEASIRFVGPKCGKKATAVEAMKCTSVSNAAMGRALAAYKKCPLTKTMTISDADIQQYSASNSH